MNARASERAHNPLVSLCLPTYQSEATLERTLKTLLRQTYQHLEILVVDNASSDGTVEVAHRVSAGDPRVRVVTSKVNVGAEGNFRRCVELASGELIALFHADDLYDPAIVERQVRFLQQHPQAAAVFVEALLIDAADRPFAERRTPGRLIAARSSGTYDFLPVFRAVLRHHNFLMTPSAMVRREVYKRLCLFDHARFGSSADLDVWLQILHEAPVGILHECLMGYRISPDQGSVTLIRQRTDRADFFKVLDTWMDRPDVAAGLGTNDYRNYAWLDKADRLMRALALSERGAQAEAMALLVGLYSPAEVLRAFVERPRAVVCAALSLLMKTRQRVGLHPSRSLLVDRLRRLARI